MRPGMPMSSTSATLGWSGISMLRELFWFVVWWMMAMSIFNALMLFWLGVTIFLNAEKRNRGVYLITAGLLVGTLFFVSHTVIVGYEMTFYGLQDLDFWWFIGWIPV